LAVAVRRNSVVVRRAVDAMPVNCLPALLWTPRRSTYKQQIVHSNNGVRTTEIYLKATDTRDTANDSERRSARTPIRVLKELISMHLGE